MSRAARSVFRRRHECLIGALVIGLLTACGTPRPDPPADSFRVQEDHYQGDGELDSVLAESGYAGVREVMAEAAGREKMNIQDWIVAGRHTALYVDLVKQMGAPGNEIKLNAIRSTNALTVDELVPLVPLIRTAYREASNSVHRELIGRILARTGD